MLSGVRLLSTDLEDALERGLRVRLLTTDYLRTTEPDALARLLDLSESHGVSMRIRVFSDPHDELPPKGVPLLVE